jgi:hypothetical protein
VLYDCKCLVFPSFFKPFYQVAQLPFSPLIMFFN